MCNMKHIDRDMKESRVMIKIFLDMRYKWLYIIRGACNVI